MTNNQDLLRQMLAATEAKQYSSRRKYNGVPTSRLDLRRRESAIRKQLHSL